MVSKHWKPRKKTVELHGAARPSRIRRDPPPKARPAGSDKAARADLEERETLVVVIGIILFAVALAIIILGFSDITSK